MGNLFSDMGLNGMNFGSMNLGGMNLSSANLSNGIQAGLNVVNQVGNTVRKNGRERLNIPANMNKVNTVINNTVNAAVMTGGRRRKSKNVTRRRR